MIVEKLIFDDYLKIGVETIDQEHSFIFDKINSIIDLNSKKPLTRNEIFDALHDFQEYQKYHFLNEEKLMNEIHYPNYKNHKEIHDKLKNIINLELYTLQYGTDIFDIDEFLIFIKSWWDIHICNQDVRISRWKQKMDELRNYV